MRSYYFICSILLCHERYNLNHNNNKVKIAFRYLLIVVKKIILNNKMCINTLV